MKTQERLNVLTVIIALAVYCLTCWIIGFILVFLGKVHDDLIPGVTMYAPLMPLAYLTIFVEEKIIYNAKVRKYQKTAKWIATELQKKDIWLHSFGINDDLRYYNYNALHQACEVQADLRPEKDVEMYREVYALAIKKFHERFTPRELCSGASPEWPLNREWAKNVGIDEYFSEHFNPCIYCDNRQPMGWHWGNDAFHTKPHNKANGHSFQRTYTCVDDSEKTFSGWLCEDCETTHIGPWKSMLVN